jgi:hypothetical protein
VKIDNSYEDCEACGMRCAQARQEARGLRLGNTPAVRAVAPRNEVTRQE